MTAKAMAKRAKVGSQFDPLAPRLKDPGATAHQRGRSEDVSRVIEFRRQPFREGRGWRLSQNGGMR
jgi:hypothetical protein